MSNQDREHLRLLSIFYYVLAGIAGVFSLFPIVQIVFTYSVVLDVIARQPSPMAREFGWIMMLMSVTMILAGLACAACLGVAGHSLTHRRNYTFCIVVAAISCAFMPLGTALGVFTIIVLMRDGVKREFGVAGVEEYDPL